MRHMLMFVFAIAVFTSGALAQDYAAERRRMVEEVEAMVASLAPETGIEKLDPRVVAALSSVPRHEFVAPGQERAGYKNRALSIGQGQTISQPIIIALMSDLLDVKAGDTVLEVGTGSGYQAAILSKLAGEVYSIEIIPDLGKRAAEVLSRLGYDNVTTKIGDGYKGWPEHAPFDAIIVTAAPDHIPAPLIEQLKPGARMVIPVGGFAQDLMVVTKQPDGRTITRTTVPVRFVPLVREK